MSSSFALSANWQAAAGHSCDQHLHAGASLTPFIPSLPGHVLHGCGSIHARQRSCTPPYHCSLTVVLAAKGYPGSYAKGSPVTGLEGVTGAKVFHAGTSMKDGQVVSANAYRALISAGFCQGMLIRL